MNHYTINLSGSELEALQKTVGIALDNLTQKITKHGKDNKIGMQAATDRMLLLDVQSEIVDALREEYSV